MNWNELDQDVQKTLDTYRDLDPVTVSADFFVGVQRKIRLSREETQKPLGWLKLSLGTAALAVVLAINIFTVAAVLQNTESEPQARRQAMLTLVDEYAIQTTAFDYDAGTGGM